MIRYHFQYEFESTLSPRDREIIRDVLGMHVTGVNDEWKDTPGSVRLDAETTLYLERAADDGLWWFTLSGTERTPEHDVADMQRRVEEILPRISASWRQVQQSTS